MIIHKCVFVHVYTNIFRHTILSQFCCLSVCGFSDEMIKGASSLVSCCSLRLPQRNLPLLHWHVHGSCHCSDHFYANCFLWSTFHDPQIYYDNQ